MKDLISRSEVKNIAKAFTFTFAEEKQRYMDFLDYCLDNAPTVDAVPVVLIEAEIEKIQEGIRKYGDNQIVIGRMWALQDLLDKARKKVQE